MIPVAKTKGQFAQELGISESTLRRRLKELAIPATGRLLSPKEQEIIRQALGYPPVWPFETYSGGGGRILNVATDRI